MQKGVKMTEKNKTVGLLFLNILTAALCFLCLFTERRALVPFFAILFGLNSFFVIFNICQLRKMKNTYKKYVKFISDSNELNNF